MDPDTDNTESPMLDTVNIKRIAGQKFKQYLAAISVSLGAVCAGTNFSWTSPVLEQLSQKNLTSNETIPSQAFQLTSNEAAIVGGILAIGALVTAIPTGFLADKIGRKKTIILISLTFLFSWVLIIFAVNAKMLIAGRFFAGMATGAICVTAPMYVGEIAETSTRGVLGSFFQLFLCSGVLFTCIIGSFTTWTILSVILATIPLIFGISFLFMPESPIYLIKIDNVEEAEKNLRELRGSEYDVGAELKIIQKEIEESNKKKAGIKDILTSKANRIALISVVGVLAFQQFAGISAIVFYTAPIFKAAGSTLSPDVAAIIVGLVQVVTSYISVLIVDKANRRYYLMISSVGMFIALAALGMFFHMKSLDVNISKIGFIPIGSAVLFMVFFSIGYGPIPWLLLGELLSPEIRGIGSGFGALSNWISAFLVTFFFPILNNACGSHVSFYILAVSAGIATVFVYFVVPETREKSLQEIQEILNK